MMNFLSIMIYLFWIIMLMILLIILWVKLHPIILMILMISLNILSCLILSLWKSNYLYSCLIFLFMISGILIIFMYFSSLVSNEQTSYKWKFSFKMFFIMSLNIYLFLLYIIDHPMLIQNMYFLNFNEINSFNLIFTFKNTNIINIYIYPLNNFTFISICFLLLSFFSIIKINSSSHSYTMRKIFNYDKMYKKFY